MKCPFCGYENTEGSKFCCGCGRKLEQPQQNLRPDPAFRERPPKSREKIEAEERRRRMERQPVRRGQSQREKKIILMGVILACVVAAGGVGAYFGVSYFLNKDSGYSAAASASSSGDMPFSESSSGTEEEEKNMVSPAPTETEAPTFAPTETPEPTPKAVTVSLVDAERADLGAYTKAAVASGTASSTVSQEGYDNSVNSMFDGDVVTSWQEGADGDGINEFVNLKLDREYQVKYITLNLGNWRDQQRYEENNVPKSLTIWLDEKSFRVEFPHEREQFCLEFSQECPASEIYVRIDEVYEGDLWDDTCISEIGIYGK